MYLLYFSLLARPQFPMISSCSVCPLQFCIQGRKGLRLRYRVVPDFFLRVILFFRDFIASLYAHILSAADPSGMTLVYLHRSSRHSRLSTGGLDKGIALLNPCLIIFIV